MAGPVGSMSLNFKPNESQIYADSAETSFDNVTLLNKTSNLIPVVSTSLADPKIQPAGPTNPNPPPTFQGFLYKKWDFSMQNFQYHHFYSITINRKIKYVENIF